MKKKLSFALIAILVVILVMSTVLVACKKKDENGNEVTLTSIKLETSSLTVDSDITVDSLKSQIKVVAVYSDGSETAITDFEISGFDPTVVGTAQTVTVTYQGQTYTMTVTVNAGDTPIVTPTFSATVGENAITFEQAEGAANVFVAKVTLTKGQEIVLKDADGNPIALGGFNGIADIDGEYVITVTVGETLSVKVDVPQAPVVVETSYVAKVGDKETAFVKDDASGIYTATVALKVGDVLEVYDNEGAKLAFADPNNFNGTAAIEGDYELTVAPTAAVVRVVVPQAPEEEYGFYAQVNGGVRKADFVEGAEGVYSLVIELNVGENVEVKDTDGKLISFSENFDGNVTVAGEYKFEILPTALIVNVTLPEVQPEKTVYFVIYGNDKAELVYNEDQTDYDEYYAILVLEEGDFFVINDNKGNRYVNYENEGFNGTAPVAGEYEVYLKLYEGGAKVYVVIPEVQPEKTVYYVSYGNDKAELVRNEAQTDYEEYAVKVTLEEGVTISVLDNKGGVYSNYENEFNGTATISGEYAVYLKLYEGGAKVYVVVPVVEEAKYFIEINEGDAQAFVKNGDKEEYMFSATLAVGDKVVIRDVTGAPIESYENSNVFSGTAKVEGDYVFYVKVGEKVTVYTEAPSSDAKATIYYYNSNSWNVVNAYAWEGSNEYLGAFPGVAMNAIADEPDWYFVEISVNAVNVIFSGVAGEQTDNLVIDFDKPYFKDGVWYAEKPSDVQPNETVYTLTSGDKTVVLAKDNEGQFVGVIELEADAVVAIADNKGNVYDNYEKDCGFNGTATIEGRYTFYLKINDAGYTIWVTVPEQEDETIVLYYYNEYSWNGVNAYAWSFPDDGVAIEYLGSYPGKPMSAIADEPGWYSVEVSVNATNVKFSGFGDGEETGDLAISARTPYYKEGSWYAEKPEEEVNDYVFAIFVDDEFAVAMEYENGEFGEQYVGSAELTDDDTIKIVDAEGNPYDNYQTEGFDGTAAFGNGTYTFYLKINDENKIYVDFEAFDEIEYEYAIFVNDDYYADLDYSEGEFGSEYVGSVSVEEGDFIAIFDAKGNNVARNGFSYKEVNDGEMQFNGTVSANGTFYFWLKENEQTVWFAFEEAAEEDSVLLYFFNDYGLDAIYAYAWTDGEQVGDAPTEYLGKFPGTAMEETDVEGWLVIKVSLKAANIIFSDGTGNQDAQTDDLIIDATTPYFYDGEWYEEMPDIGEDETTYSIYVDGEYKTTMIKYEFGEDDEDNKYYGAVTVEAGAVIVIMDELGEVYNNYVDETFNGTAAAAGLYELSMGFGEDHPITVEFTEATEPEYEYAIFVNGEFVKGLNWVINEFEQEQFENSVSVEEGDEIVIKDAEGNDVIVDLEFVYVTVEGDVDFEGTAFAEGTYSFYLKEGEKKIYWTYAEPEVEDETINVYFYNKDGWDSVYAYAWSGSDEEGDKVEYLGVWNEEVSGTEMLVTDFDGWFVVEVSAKASYVIFNNGNGEQTDNLELNSERPFFYNGEWYEEMPGFEDEYEYAIFINGEFFGALTEIDGVYRVGVLLNEGDEVSIKDLDEVEYNNFQGEFNGVAGATGFYDFYMSAREGNPITVEFSDVVEEYDYAVFVNGEKAATLILAESDFGEQYEGSAFALMGDEIVIKDAEGNDVSTDLGYEFINGEAEEVFEGIAFADGTYYFYLKESELTVYWSFAEPEVEDETINVYFYNKDGWDSVYAYAWSGSDEEGDKVEYLGVWNEEVSGTEMLVTDFDGWFVVEVSAKASYVIFNNGNGNQTDNLELNSDYPFFFGGDWYEEMPDFEDEYDYAVFVNGEKAATLILAENDFGEQYEGSAFALMGDVIFIKDAEGNDVLIDLGYEFINGEAEEVFEGIAFADGTYYFYLKEGEKKIYWTYAEPEVEDETINVYFYNKDGWDSVYAYAWSGSDEEGDKVEYLGVWNEEVSGTEMLVTDFDGWFVVEVSAKATYIIFNNGNGNQTDNLELNSDYPFFFGGDWYEEMPEEEPDVTYAYFYNKNGWETVYAYAWSGSDEEGDKVEYLGEWSGSEMEYCFVGEEYAYLGEEARPHDAIGWYGIEINAKATFIIFNNGNGEQTDNLELNPDYPFFYNGEWYDEMPAEEEEGTITLYFYNNDGWQTIYAYAWSGSDEGGDKVEYLGVWNAETSGTEMLVTEFDGWFAVEVSVNATYIIFNDGNGEQTDNLEIDAENHCYYYGDWIEEIPVEDEQITIFYYNKNGWDNVYAYVWNESGELVDWPGSIMSAADIGEGWYSIDISAIATSIVFNNGAGAQTEDIAIDAENHYYNDGWLSVEEVIG